MDRQYVDLLGVFLVSSCLGGEACQDARPREGRAHVPPLLLPQEELPSEEAKIESFLDGSGAPHSGHTRSSSDALMLRNSSKSAPHC